ncbi:hypothetical protein AVEN_182649-1 [Araneus ventricosus]|uniref:Uncharacterized protein n=1 Tax=Araneus ventricosus TaxID=182803 RepID=A0A4Y2IPF2_ARAVE|nr:hypothetical protein AVEN_182649-1 [Araneus ventricosus]
MSGNKIGYLLLKQGTKPARRCEFHRASKVNTRLHLVCQEYFTEFPWYTVFSGIRTEVSPNSLDFRDSTVISQKSEAILINSAWRCDLCVNECNDTAVASAEYG